MSLWNLPDQIARRYRRTKKQLSWTVRCKLARKQLGGATHTVLLHPEKAPVFSAFYKLSHFAQLKITTDPTSKFDLAIYYHDETLRNPDPAIRKVAESRRVINFHLRDIRKETLQHIFGEVFGYNLAIDPLTHHGPAVRKSNLNAAHDGEVVQCPLKPHQLQPDSAYQRVIDNTVESPIPELTTERHVLDHRMPVMGDVIPICYLKYRPISSRFSNTNSYAEVADPDVKLSPDERAKIVRFCRAAGVDYAEVDVLRDNADGRIYLVDVNPTPWGPPNHIKPEHELLAVRKMAAGFRKGLLDYETRCARGEIGPLNPTAG
jgi:hypothetical protein